MPCWIMTLLAWPLAYCLAFTEIAGSPNGFSYAMATFYFVLGAAYLYMHLRGYELSP